MLTIFLTVVTGVTVFVIGQLLVKFIIDPIKELKQVIGEIQFSLTFHAQAIYTPVGDEVGEDVAQKEIRKLASSLRSKVEMIPCYRFFSKILGDFLPPKNSIIDASVQLIGLSNSLHQWDRSKKNSGRVKKIQELLVLGTLQ